MKSASISFVFGLLFFIVGYFSWQKVTEYYLNGATGNITDMRMFLIAPLFSAAFWLVFFLASKKIFTRMLYLTPGKEIIFYFLFLAANVIILFALSKLASFIRSDELKMVQLAAINSPLFAIIYLASASLSLALFWFLRRKYSGLYTTHH